jgi:hypothetical protein
VLSERIVDVTDDHVRGAMHVDVAGIRRRRPELAGDLKPKSYVVNRLDELPP